MNRQPSVIYRKKPDPCKIVTFSSLNKTDSGDKKSVNDSNSQLRWKYFIGFMDADFN